MPQKLIGAPVFCQFYRTSTQIAVILLKFRFEAAEKRESVRRGPRKSSKNLVLIKAPDLLGGMLDHAFAQSHLSVSRHDNTAIAAHTQHCCGTNQTLLRHEGRILIIAVKVVRSKRPPALVPEKSICIPR